MPGKYLNQAELDWLLEAIAAGEIDPEDYSMVGEQRVIHFYDFHRRGALRTDDVRVLQDAHEPFIKALREYLESRTGLPAFPRPESFSPVTLNKYLRILPNPGFIARLRLGPGHDPAFFVMDPSLLFAIINSMLGGSIGAVKNREATPTEIAIAGALVTRILNMWSRILPDRLGIHPEPLNYETDPFAMSLPSPSDGFIALNFKVDLGDCSGSLEFCVARATADEILRCVRRAEESFP